MVGTRIGKFIIVGTLGTGAHSKILQIRRREDARNYALKVVPVAGPQDQKYVDQAHHEFRVAQLLDHPNLIKIYSLETCRDWLFRPRNIHLLIEYVYGGTLDTLKPLSIPKLVQVFALVAAGMRHMHKRKVYHADLKPNNIMLSRAGEVKILDFGLAWIRGEIKERFQGTPEYMAHEQVKRPMANERTDIYNLGATMYRMTTFRLPPSPIAAPGDLPLDARSWEQILKPVNEFNAGAPPELCLLIRKCLAFNPEQRPENMKEILKVLKSLREKLVRSPEDRLEAVEW